MNMLALLLIVGCKNSVIPTDGSVTSIGDYAFESCTKLTSITIPSSVTGIGNGAFQNCKSLESITIPDSVTSIGGYAFAYCTGLTSITVPESVTSIGNIAFYGCTSLTDVYYGGTKRKWTKISIGTNNECLTNATIHFSGFSEGLSFTSNGDGTCYVSGIGTCTDTEIIIPSLSPGGDIVSSIDSGAFKYKNITSVSIPDSVVSICDEAFWSCSGLTSITIGNGVTYISCDAFYDTAYWNNSSNWENGVLYIGKYLIASKNTVSGAYTIKPGTITIAQYAFCDSTNLTSITIPDSVTSIDDNAFEGCTKLTSVTFGENSQLISIGSCAFVDCTSLTSITIPAGVTSIDGGAFIDCTSLESITVDGGNTVYHSDGNCIIETSSKTLIAGCKNSVIPTDGSVTSIGSGAFYYCTSLTNIEIPSSVTSIGGYAFAYCTGLTRVTILNDTLNTNSMSDYFRGVTLSNITFRGHSGSAIEAWATQNRYAFEYIIVEGNITLSKVTFDQNGGSGGSAQATVTSQKTYSGSIPTAPTKSGYIFVGYYNSADCFITGASDEGLYINSSMNIIKEIQSDITLYAHWVKEKETKNIVSKNDHYNKNTEVTNKNTNSPSEWKNIGATFVGYGLIDLCELKYAGYTHIKIRLDFTAYCWDGCDGYIRINQRDSNNNSKTITTFKMGLKQANRGIFWSDDYYINGNYVETYVEINKLIDGGYENIGIEIAASGSDSNCWGLGISNFTFTPVQKAGTSTGSGSIMNWCQCQ